MTYNIPATLFNVLLAAFFIVVILGVVLGAYAATALKRCEGSKPAPPAKPAADADRPPAA